MINVTAVILTCGRPMRCMDSVWHNTLAMQGLDAETIVVNNGPEPVSLPPAIAGIPCRVIKMRGNLGVVARNAGIREAAGEIILVLDDDTYMDPLLAQKAVTALRNDPDVGAVAFRVHNGRKEDEACLLPTVFHGCACGFRRSAIVRVGGYPSDYLYYGEEYDVAFRLYGAGYRIVLCNGPQRIRHERDPAGRSVARIIRLLIRNNTTFLWMHFPLPFLPLAFRDVLQRYRLVAGKEHVPEGYSQGVRSVPAAMIRGMLRRKPMAVDIFRRAAVLDRIESCSRRLLCSGAGEVVVCGAGKFPSLQLAALRRNGLRVRAVLDTNACWKHTRIGGVPVVTDPADIASWLGIGIPCIVGAASLPDNENWRDRLMIRHGYRRGVPEEAITSTGETIDLLDYCRIAEFWPGTRVSHEGTSRGTRAASFASSEDFTEATASVDRRT